MDVYLTILIISVALPTVHLDNERNLLQFYQMIECTLPNSSPLMSFADYGCYCGLGGSGSPVDQLDTCCRVHDKCYGDARLHKNCQPVVDVPYFEFYDFKCNTAERTITCLDTNDECEMFICQCDKIAAECFAGAPYNASNNHLSSSVCSSASRQSCSFISALVALTVSLLFCNKISTK